MQGKQNIKRPFQLKPDLENFSLESINMHIDSILSLSINNSDSISDQIKDINIGDKLSVNFKKINNEISIPFWIKD